VRPVTTLRWLVNALDIPWDLSKVEGPLMKVKSMLGMDSRQAPAVQPPMLLQLELQLEEAMKAGTSTWPALWVAWCMTHGAIREEHLKRSYIDQWKPVWMSFICPRGNRTTPGKDSGGGCPPHS